MKIAFLVVKDLLNGGGIEKYSLELGMRLVKRGHRVRIYTTRNKHDGTWTNDLGIDIIGVPNIPLVRTEKLSGSITGVVGATLSKWPDVFHLHTLAPGAMGWLPRLFHFPCVLQFHGLEWKRTRWGPFGRLVAKELERICAMVNDNFTAVSHVQCAYYLNKYGLHTQYIPCGTDIKTCLPADKILELGLQPRKYLLFASRLVKEKGAHYLISAFKALETDYKLVIAGDIPGKDKYKSELCELARGDTRIIFTGFVKGQLLEELFSNALIYVQPSEIEGLSIALLEAMSYGLCCIVSDIPENIEAVRSAGICFKNGDIQHLKEKLVWILSNPKQIASFGKQAKLRVEREYSWDKITLQFEALYQSVINKFRFRSIHQSDRRLQLR